MFYLGNPKTGGPTEDLAMKPIRTFTVVPRLPAPLSRLRELAVNLNWAWNHDTIELFRRLAACGDDPGRGALEDTRAAPGAACRLRPQAPAQTAGASRSPIRGRSRG